MNFLIKLESYLRNIFNKIPTDKKDHFILGAIFTSFILIFLKLIVVKHIAVLIAFLLVIFLSYIIEIFQLKTKSGNYDLYDMIATILGGLIIIISNIG